jgi:peptide/nickel transport system substrate-binding protein
MAACFPLARRSTTLVVALVIATAACRSRVRPNRESVTIVGLPAVTTDPHLHSHLPTFGALSNFYEGLVSLDPSSALVPQLATVWENPSETVWRIHLRRGVVFHDGRPFGAADVVTSLERARRLPGSEVVDAVKSIERARAIDDFTVEITTLRPSATLLAQLAYVPIVPRDATLSPITRPIGTGPYRFVLGRPYGKFEGERFDRYWGARPLFPHYRYLPIESPALQARWIEEGRADVAAFVPRSMATARRADGFRVIRGRPLINFLLGLVQRPGSPFFDVRCRRAVALTLDRDRLARCDVDRILSPLGALIPSGVFGSAPAAASAPDAAGARRLLAEAGHANGLDVSCLLYEGDLAIGRELARQLSAAGVRVSLRSLPRRSYFPALSDEKDELFLFNWVSEWGDAAQLLDGFLHSRKGNYGEHNYIGNGDSELDLLIERADRILDPSARIVALADAVGYAQRDLPVIPLAVETRLVAVRSDLDFTPRADGILRAFDLRARPDD